MRCLLIRQIGRTARGGKSGVAISLVTIPDAEQFETVRQAMQEQAAEAGVGEGDGTPALRPFKFKMDDVNSFRYRVEDALASVTKSAIREARLKEIKAEIMISEKLKVPAVAWSLMCPRYNANAHLNHASQPAVVGTTTTGSL